MKKFFVPGNVSCIFKICSDPNPSVAGSMGLGFTVNKGVEVSVKQSDHTIVFWNEKEITLPTVLSVIQKLTSKKLSVSISSDLPLGCGFGLSGASALGAAYAINDLFLQGKSKIDLAKIAHIADVENGTGLGDVTNEYFGGILLKTVPSSKFQVEKLPFNNIPVFVKYFSPISTKEIISDKTKREQIDIVGEKAIKKIEKLLKEDIITFKDIIQISKQFAQQSGLLVDQTVKNVIADIEEMGGHASMIMLGNAVFADISFSGSQKLFITDKI